MVPTLHKLTMELIMHFLSKLQTKYEYSHNLKANSCNLLFKKKKNNHNYTTILVLSKNYENLKYKTAWLCGHCHEVYFYLFMLLLLYFQSLFSFSPSSSGIRADGFQYLFTNCKWQQSRRCKKERQIKTGLL